MPEFEHQGQELFSDHDVEQIKARYERQLRLAAAMAAANAAAPEAPRGAQVPDFPKEPNFLQTTVTIPSRFFEESIRHINDSTGIVGGITDLLKTPEGRALLARLKDALLNHHDDPELFGDFLAFFTSKNKEYGSLVLGVITEAQGVQGIAATTGVAVPVVKGSGKPKWFSGLKRSKGLILEATASLLFGYRVEEPQNLTGQFYGYHAGVDIGLSIGTNFYFDTSKQLKYEGFLTSFGIGVGVGTSVFWGWELVTSD